MGNNTHLWGGDTLTTSLSPTLVLAIFSAALLLAALAAWWTYFLTGGGKGRDAATDRGIVANALQTAINASRQSSDTAAQVAARMAELIGQQESKAERQDALAAQLAHERMYMSRTPDPFPRTTTRIAPTIDPVGDEDEPENGHLQRPGDI